MKRKMLRVVVVVLATGVVEGIGLGSSVVGSQRLQALDGQSEATSGSRSGLGGGRESVGDQSLNSFADAGLAAQSRVETVISNPASVGTTFDELAAIPSVNSRPESTAEANSNQVSLALETISESSRSVQHLEAKAAKEQAGLQELEAKLEALIVQAELAEQMGSDSDSDSDSVDSHYWDSISMLEKFKIEISVIFGPWGCPRDENES